jgi:hypothetical protein
MRSVSFGRVFFGGCTSTTGAAGRATETGMSPIGDACVVSSSGLDVETIVDGSLGGPSS